MGAARETEVLELAARLQGLKEQSGRSYGALARRLGMGQSTLHRYCSGATVPVEFAPLERFARLCGAKPEELVALHRLWNAADAARNQRVSPTSTTTATVPGTNGRGAGAPEPREQEPHEQEPHEQEPEEQEPEEQEEPRAEGQRAGEQAPAGPGGLPRGPRAPETDPEPEPEREPEPEPERESVR